MENEKTIGITGASGALGQELIKLFIDRFKIIFFSELNKYLFMSFNQIKI